MQLIRELGVTNGDESKVGYYVGIVVRKKYDLSVCQVNYRLICGVD